MVLCHLIREVTTDVEEMHEWPISRPNWVPVQKNDYDCGMYVILMIQEPELGPDFPIKVLIYCIHDITMLLLTSR